MGEKVLLEISGIRKSFAKVSVLRDINISFVKGECHALLGENGAGKSTLMKILAGAYTRDAGEILLEGKPLEFSSPLEAKEYGISIIYQELSLIPTLSAGENVFLGELPNKAKGIVDWKSIHQRAAEYFAEVDLYIDPRTLVKDLSVAQCQLIEISRALSANAKVVIMDEPTSSLTDKEIAKLHQLIAKLKDQGITVIYISHKLEEIFAICDRATVLKDGEMSGTRNIADTNKDELVSLMVGRTLDQYYPTRVDRDRSRVLLEAKHLRAGKAVKDVSFAVHRGEVLGFFGLVGAGRTETMRAIFGADKLDGGDIHMDGKLVRNKTPLDSINNKIAFSTEDRRDEGLVMTMSVRENTTLANYGSFAGKLGLISKTREREIAAHYIEKMHTRTSGMEQLVVNLSGGNQQKVVISKWLNTGAELFIFDEPTRGIDVGAKAEIYQLIVSLCQEGKAVIVVSSELPEILGICDRVAVMHEGTIAGFLDIEEASEESIMALAVGGLD